MPSLVEIREALLRHRPTVSEAAPQHRAAVAVVLRNHAESLDLLLIERALRDGDPWSGHMAFPGGRICDVDATPRAAAERETLEEVGLSLAGAEFLGRLDDVLGMQSATRQLVISAHVFHVVDSDPLVPNQEVKEAFWFPLDALTDPERHVDHPIQHGSLTHAPGILVGEPGRQVVWGLTYRFLEDFLRVLGQPLPQRRYTPSSSD
jgi:8-oxo-dGTP pyrophosphatase MutT (NUDIX family)